MLAPGQQCCIWLIGKPTANLCCSRLPSKGEVLSNFLFHHMEEKLPVNKSLKMTITAVIEYWNKARIPTQRADNAERKLKKLFNEYLKLKKARKIQKPSCRMNEDIFKGDLTELFDIAAASALETVTCEEDNAFLQLQREDLASASFGSKDKNLTQQETRKRKRCMAEQTRKRIADHENQERWKVVDPTSAVDSFASSLSTSEDEEDYKPSISSQAPSAPSTDSKTKKKLLTHEVAMSLDRVNISDRKATFVIAATAKALGQDLDSTLLSRSTVRRSRKACREKTEGAVN